MFRPRRSSSAEETEDEGESGPINTETDDVMAEGESGGKLVNKFVKGGGGGAGNSYGGRGGCSMSRMGFHTVGS